MRIHKKNLKEYKLLIDAKSKIFYSTTTESFRNRTGSAGSVIGLYIKLIIG